MATNLFCYVVSEKYVKYVIAGAHVLSPLQIVLRFLHMVFASSCLTSPDRHLRDCIFLPVSLPFLLSFFLFMFSDYGSITYATFFNTKQ
ncbi:hypothetical protein TSMEX_001526 [Taenia solium]|eukprot:TsM_000140300 transcript=TsM_000140300 gene=TsM_000140300